MERVYSLNNRRQAWSVSSMVRQSSIGLTLISSCSGVTCLQPKEAGIQDSAYNSDSEDGSFQASEIIKEAYITAMNQL